MSKVLVTGVAGLVGSAAAKVFSEKGYEVIGIDNNGRAAFFDTPIKDFQGIDMNICDENSINQLFIEHEFDVIIHAAAQPSHDYSKDHVKDDFLVNAWGTIVLLEATRHYRPNATFIYVSTDKVYGERMGFGILDDNGQLLRREDREHPTRVGSYFKKFYGEDLGLDFAGNRSPFGCSKAAADMYVQEYGNYFGVKTACFRCGCITGKNHEGAELHGFLAYLTKCIKEGKTYKVFGYKGKQVRDQIHADDLANAFWHFAQNPKVAAVYNMGGGPERSVSILEAVELIKKELTEDITDEEGITVATTTPRGKLEFIDEPRKGDRIFDVHDVSKFRSQYPEWDYQYDLKDIIRDVCSK